MSEFGGAVGSGRVSGLGIPGYEDAVEIGRGGFGVVYRARQVDLDRVVAVKVLTTFVDAPALVRFDRERKALGALSDHPNIVTIFESGTTLDGHPFITMEYLGGGALSAQLVDGSAMERWQAVRITVAVCGAVETAHRAGLLHRDIKPENLLVDRRGQVRLADFGIARSTGAATATGSVTASIAHAAPEILAGQPASAASDVYALGSSLFALVSGGPAFMRPTDESLVPVFVRVSSEPVPDLRTRGLPGEVAAVIERAMAKDPHDRFPSADSMGEALQEAQRAHGVTVTPMVVEAIVIEGPAGAVGTVAGGPIGGASGPTRIVVGGAVLPPLPAIGAGSETPAGAVDLGPGLAGVAAAAPEGDIGKAFGQAASHTPGKASSSGPPPMPAKHNRLRRVPRRSKLIGSIAACAMAGAVAVGAVAVASGDGGDTVEASGELAVSVESPQATTTTVPDGSVTSTTAHEPTTTRPQTTTTTTTTTTERPATTTTVGVEASGELAVSVESPQATTTVPEGSVTSTTVPEPTTTRPPTTTTTTAPTTTTTFPPTLMPDVVGLNETNATAAVTAAQSGFRPQGYSNFRINRVCNGNTDPAKFNFVFDQDPDPGTALAFRQPAVISVYESCTTVPSFVGLDFTAARDLAFQSALQGGQITATCQAGVPSWTVISQDVPAGTIVKVNSIIQLVHTPQNCPP